jgi:hypothetical protein
MDESLNNPLSLISIAVDIARTLRSHPDFEQTAATIIGNFAIDSATSAQAIELVRTERAKRLAELEQMNSPIAFMKADMPCPGEKLFTYNRFRIYTIPELGGLWTPAGMDGVRSFSYQDRCVMYFRKLYESELDAYCDFHNRRQSNGK